MESRAIMIASLGLDLVGRTSGCWVDSGVTLGVRSLHLLLLRDLEAKEVHEHVIRADSLLDLCFSVFLLSGLRSFLAS